MDVEVMTGGTSFSVAPAGAGRPFVCVPVADTDRLISGGPPSLGKGTCDVERRVPIPRISLAEGDFSDIGFLHGKLTRDDASHA
jgi:hypothetical protein